MPITVEVEEMITVGALAEKLNIPVSKLIAELMKNGIMATVNETIDFDTAQIIVEDLNLDIDLQPISQDKIEIPKRQKPKNSEQAISRPPVVAVMGHVDHGKTSLLDAIRDANVVKGEAGGITQHISAYQIEHNKRLITFLDTPGHEAFAAIREHGAQLTDIVILVVAADDGVKPQTIEAIKYAQKAGVKIIVAINKIDKEGADSAKIKQQLSEHNVLVEEWGGDTIVQEVSAKTKQGIKELLDMVLLLSDVEELKADIDVPARGLVIEAHVELGRGPVAYALVEAGILKAGQYIYAGATYAKIRNLETTTGKKISEAKPSTPVAITGFNMLPEFGDEFVVVANEKIARNMANTAMNNKKVSSAKSITSNELIRMINHDRELSELNIIVKADVKGSLTSVVDSLKILGTNEVAVRIVSSGVGSITDNDLRLSKAANATIYGFNVNVPSSIRQQAARDKVDLRLFNVIYELIDDVKLSMEQLLKPEVIENEVGTLIVRGIFNTTKSLLICGGEVTKGKLVVPSLARVFRDKVQLMEVEVVGLKRGPTEVKEVLEKEMCGVSLKTPQKLDLVVGDRIIFYTQSAIERHL